MSSHGNRNKMDLVSSQDQLVHSFIAQFPFVSSLMITCISLLPLPCILNSQRTSGSLDPFLRFRTKNPKNTSGRIWPMDICAKSEINRSSGF